MILTGIAKDKLPNKYDEGKRYFFTLRPPERDSYTGNMKTYEIWESKNKHGLSEAFSGQDALRKYFKDIE